MDSTTTTSKKPLHHHHHPLHQIAESPTHKLLLKQWLKESDLIARRVAVKQSRIDTLRSDTTFLFCFFFLFHSTFLLLLFHRPPSPTACRQSWVPCAASLVSSMAMVWAVRYKIDDERQVGRVLEREREDGVLLARCVEELRRKGVEFDLLKEVDALRRAKSLRVGSGIDGGSGGERRWEIRDVMTMFLFAASCAFLAITRSMLCH